MVCSSFYLMTITSTAGTIVKLISMYVMIQSYCKNINLKFTDPLVQISRRQSDLDIP